MKKSIFCICLFNDEHTPYLIFECFRFKCLIDYSRYWIYLNEQKTVCTVKCSITRIVLELLKVLEYDQILEN